MQNEVARLNQSELDARIPDSASWHHSYKDTSWIYVGNLSRELCEGDVLCVFSQYGEIDDLIFPRDEETGLPRGFCFIKYEDWRSTVLSVDNFNAAELLGFNLKVDHHRPAERFGNKTAEERLADAQSGAAFGEVEGPYTLHNGVNLFAKPERAPEEDVQDRDKGDERRHKKKKKHKRADPV